MYFRNCSRRAKFYHGSWLYPVDQLMVMINSLWPAGVAKDVHFPLHLQMARITEPSCRFSLTFANCLLFQNTTSITTMKNTPFTEKHIALGAKMAAFAGYNMPISYTGINDEHAAVRNNAGVFDVSHMGEFILKGA